MKRRAIWLAGLAALGLFVATIARAESPPERALTGMLQSERWKALLLAPVGSDADQLDGCVTLVVPARLRGDLDFFNGGSVEVSGEYFGSGISPAAAPGDPVVMHRRYEGWPLEDWCQGKFLFVTAMKKANDKP